jgi:ankyrin repeat protein
MCALLLQAGADIELADGNGRRPLHVAASLDDVQLIQMLLQRSVKVNSTRKSDSWNALHFAAEAGAFRAVNFLLQLGFPVDGCANNLATTLHIACWNKAPAVVNALIMAKANVNHQMTRGWSALAIACKNGDDVTTTALLKAGAHVNPVDQSVPSPLLNAVMADNGNVVTQILRAKANPNIKNKQGASAVFLASSKGLSGIVRALLQYGALPDASPGDTKVTPLMQTCAFNHLECTQLLLMAKADMNSVSKQNMTPMHLMIKNKNARGLSILLTFKANPNALILPQKNSEDQSEQLTPLFACVSYNFAEGCTILLQRGAHANFKQPSTGCTAFHSALSRKYEDCCRALVAATDLKIPNNNGQTVFDTARGESKLEALLTSPHISQPFSSTLTPMPMNMMMSGLQQQPQQQRPQHVQMSSQQTPVFFNLQRQSQQSSGGFNITSFKSSSTSAQ